MTVDPKDRKPARGYSWPPFEKGNMAHLTHGARSDRVVAETMRSMLPGTIERAPWLADPLYEEERERYLRNAAKERLLGDYILHVGETQGIEHVASRTLEQHTAASRLASQQAEGLGLTPKGFVSIHHIIASMRTPRQGLEEFLEQGRLRGARRQRELAEQAEQAPEQGDEFVQDGMKVHDPSRPPDGGTSYATAAGRETEQPVFRSLGCAAIPGPFLLSDAPGQIGVTHAPPNPYNAAAGECGANAGNPDEGTNP